MAEGFPCSAADCDYVTRLRVPDDAEHADKVQLLQLQMQELQIHRQAAHTQVGAPAARTPGSKAKMDAPKILCTSPTVCYHTAVKTLIKGALAYVTCRRCGDSIVVDSSSLAHLDLTRLGLVKRWKDFPQMDSQVCLLPKLVPDQSFTAALAPDVSTTTCGRTDVNSTTTSGLTSKQLIRKAKSDAHTAVRASRKDAGRKVPSAR